MKLNKTRKLFLVLVFNLMFYLVAVSGVAADNYCCGNLGNCGFLLNAGADEISEEQMNGSGFKMSCLNGPGGNAACIDRLHTACRARGGTYQQLGSEVGLPGANWFSQPGSCGVCVKAAATDEQWYFCKEGSADGAGTCATTPGNFRPSGEKSAQQVCQEANKGPCFKTLSECQSKASELCKPINPPKPPKPNKPPINIPILDPGSVGGILGSMNPLGGGGAGACSGVNLTIGCILGFIINTIIFPLAAIFFALMIVWGGYKIVAGGMSGSQNQVSAGKQRLIGAILGLLLLASVYWIWQLIEYLTGIKVVS